MSDDPAFVNAKKVMECVDKPDSFETIQDIVVEDAPFICQADTLADVKTVKAWCEWMQNFAANIAPDCKAEVHSVTWDSDSKIATYFGTYHAKHTGSGGPVEATNKETATHYVYIVKMNDDNRVEHFTKVWNDGYCLKELGWA